MRVPELAPVDDVAVAVDEQVDPALAPISSSRIGNPMDSVSHSSAAIHDGRAPGLVRLDRQLRSAREPLEVLVDRAGSGRPHVLGRPAPAGARIELGERRRPPASTSSWSAASSRICGTEPGGASTPATSSRTEPPASMSSAAPAGSRRSAASGRSRRATRVAPEAARERLRPTRHAASPRARRADPRPGGRPVARPRPPRTPCRTARRARRRGSS